MFARVYIWILYSGPLPVLCQNVHQNVVGFYYSAAVV